MKKNKRFEWTKEHVDAFQELKKYLSSAPILVKPLDGEPFLLYLLVSSNAVSAILAKDLNGDQHSIYYVNTILLDLETRYSNLEKLIPALVTTSSKLRQYFEMHPINV